MALLWLAACPGGDIDLPVDGGFGVDGGQVEDGGTPARPDGGAPLSDGGQAVGDAGGPGHFLLEATEADPVLDEAILEAMADDEIVGLSFAVTVGRELRYLEGFGAADREQGIPVDPRRSLFRWASVSKGLVGLVTVHHQLHAGLDVAADYRELAPDLGHPTAYLPLGCGAEACALPLPADHPPINLRRLLDHTAGVQHYSNGLEDPTPPLEMINDPEVNTGMAWALDRFLNQPLVSLPGQRSSYSSFGFNLAGVVLERDRGRSLAAQVEDVIARPLGMTSLSPDHHWHAHPDRVRGYFRNRNGIQFNGDDDVSWKLAAGGFQSTPRDFATWCAGLLSDELLNDDEKFERLWQPGEPIRNYAYGFELTWDRRGNLSSIGHGGAQQSVRTALRAYPEEGLCFTLMSNSTWADASGLLRQFETVWRGAQE